MDAGSVMNESSYRGILGRVCVYTPMPTNLEPDGCDGELEPDHWSREKGAKSEETCPDEGYICPKEACASERRSYRNLGLRVNALSTLTPAREISAPNQARISTALLSSTTVH